MPRPSARSGVGGRGGWSGLSGGRTRRPAAGVAGELEAGRPRRRFCRRACSVWAGFVHDQRGNGRRALAEAASWSCDPEAEELHWNSRTSREVARDDAPALLIGPDRWSSGRVVSMPVQAPIPHAVGRGRRVSL